MDVRARPEDGATSLEVNARGSSDRIEARLSLAEDGRVELTAKARLGAEERHVGAHRVRLRDARVDLDAAIAEGRVERLALDARCDSASVDSVPLGDVTLRAGLSEERIDWRLESDGKGGLTASAGGRLPSELSALAAVTNEPVGFELDGPIPAALIQRAISGVELSGDPVAKLAGRARLEGDRVALDELRGTIAIPALHAPGATTDLEGARLSLSARGSIGEGLDLALDRSSRLVVAHATLADLHARSLALTPHVRLIVDGAGVRLTAGSRLTARMDRLAIGTGPAALRFERVRARFGAKGSEMVAVEGDHTTIEFPIDASAARVGGVLGGHGVRAHGDLEATLAPGEDRILLPLRLRVAELTQHESESALHDARVRLPLAWQNGELEAEGTLRARRIAWRDVPIGPVSGAVRLTTDRVALAWTGPVARNTRFSLTVGVRLGERPTGSVDIAVPRSTVKESDPISRVLAELTSLHVAGPIEGALHLPIEAPSRGRARLHVDGARVAKPGGMKAEGVYGTLRLTRLSPVESAPARLAWSELAFGDFVTAGPGTAQLRLDAPHHIAVRDMEAKLAGGNCRAAPFSFDWEAPDVPLRLALRGVDLSDVLNAATKGRVRGSGRLDGTLAFRVKLGDERRLVLGPSRLSAREPGRLQVADLAELASPRVSDLDAVIQGRIVQQRVLGALSDFRYRQLVLTVDETTGTRRVRARVVGQGVRTPQELDVTLNLRGIQPLLDHALRLWPSGETTIRVRQP